MPSMSIRVSAVAFSLVLALLLLTQRAPVAAQPSPPENYSLDSVWPLHVSGAAVAPYALAFGPDGALHVAATRFGLPGPQDYVLRLDTSGAIASALPFDRYANDLALDQNGFYYRLLNGGLTRYNPEGQQGINSADPLPTSRNLATTLINGRPYFYIVAANGVFRYNGLVQDLTWTPSGDFNTPSGIAISPSNIILVADTGNQRIHRLNLNGSQAAPPFTLAEGAAPLRVAAGPDDTIFVLTTAGRIQKYSPAGELLTSWGGMGSLAGEFRYPLDLIVGPDGRVYVADTDNRRIQVFRRLEEGQATPTPIVTPTPVSACVVRTDRGIDPHTITLGGRAWVSLRVLANCPTNTLPADIAVVMDTSLSMGNENRIGLAKQAALAFLEFLNLEQDQAGVIEFNDAANARVVAALNQNRYRLQRSVVDLVHRGGTDLAAAINIAQGELTSPRHIQGHAQVMILLTDGNSAPQVAINAATVAKEAGTQIFVIGIGNEVDESLLIQIASPGRFFYTRTGSDLTDIYLQIARIVQSTDLTNVVVTDTARGDVLVTGFGSPAPSSVGSRLTWTIGNLPLRGITLTYQIQPSQPGEYDPTQALGQLTYSDGTQNQYALTFPTRTINVLAPTVTATLPPTATPTATATPRPTETLVPTATPTPVIYRTYLPYVLTFNPN